MLLFLPCCGALLLSPVLLKTNPGSAVSACLLSYLNPSPPYATPPPVLQTIVQRMSSELDRFQRERSQEMTAVLREFALCEAQMSHNSARLWRSLVPDATP